MRQQANGNQHPKKGKGKVEAQANNLAIVGNRGSREVPKKEYKSSLYNSSAQSQSFQQKRGNILRPRP